MWAIMFVFLLYGLKRLEYLEFERLGKENHKNQLLQQAGHYEALYRKTLEQRRLAHDLSNHLSTINYMIDHNQFESAFLKVGGKDIGELISGNPFAVEM